jgi:hypothetical protein
MKHFMEGLVSETLINISAGKPRRRKRAPSPEIDRRAEAPFNGGTATRLVAEANVVTRRMTGTRN